jgi:hypothetical protein
MANLGKVTLTVDLFRNNASAFPSEPYCTLVSPGGIAVTDPANNTTNKKQVGIDPNDPAAIWVQSKNATGGSAGPVDLEFTIASNDPGNSYTATGVYQFIQSQHASDPVGGNNFKRTAGSAGKLRVKNAWKNQGHVNPPQSCPRWELFIQIQDQNGMLGWIDPGIENADDM